VRSAPKNDGPLVTPIVGEDRQPELTDDRRHRQGGS
jgi:hypothetical protein